MESNTTPMSVRYYRFLPYLAVLQTDLKQTPKNWVWRTWVAASILAAALYLTHRFSIYREVKIVETVDKVIANLLRWTALGTLTLVVAFTCGAVATERGSLADSILCRGISRYQYFLAKLHSRLIAVLGTFLFLTLGVIIFAGIAFPGILTTVGSLAVIGALSAILTAVVCFGVTASALCGSTVLSISLLWVALYTIGFLMTFLPTSYLTPDRLIDGLPKMLRGLYDRTEYWRLIEYCLYASVGATLFGMFGFGRSDV